MKESIAQKQVLLAMGTRYIDRVHRGVAEYARQQRWHLTNLFGYDLNLIRQRSCDGIITALDLNDPLSEDIIRKKLPTVDLSIVCKDLKMTHLTGDNLSMGRAAARHFIDRGFQHFIWFSEKNHTAAQLRQKGFQSELRNNGFDCQPLVIADSFAAGWPDWNSLCRWVLDHVGCQSGPCAVYAYNDIQAADFLSACIAGGVRVPDELAVLGTDNHPLICPTAAVPLSSINHDLEELGRRAAEELDHIMNGAPMEHKIVEVPHRGITIRQSSDVFAINDPHVVKALRFIHVNFALNIGVSDVVQSVDVARRPLERRFQKYLQRSILGQLNQVRLENVCRMLRETSSSIAEIASASGFTTPEYLHRVFLKQTGTTPRRYRLEHRVD